MRKRTAKNRGAQACSRTLHGEDVAKVGGVDLAAVGARGLRAGRAAARPGAGGEASERRAALRQGHSLAARWLLPCPAPPFSPPDPRASHCPPGARPVPHTANCAAHLRRAQVPPEKPTSRRRCASPRPSHSPAPPEAVMPASAVTRALRDSRQAVRGCFCCTHLEDQRIPEQQVANGVGAHIHRGQHLRRSGRVRAGAAPSAAGYLCASCCSGAGWLAAGTGEGGSLRPITAAAPLFVRPR